MNSQKKEPQPSIVSAQNSACSNLELTKCRAIAAIIKILLLLSLCRISLVEDVNAKAFGCFKINGSHIPQNNEAVSICSQCDRLAHAIPIVGFQAKTFPPSRY